MKWKTKKTILKICYTWLIEDFTPDYICSCDNCTEQLLKERNQWQEDKKWIINKLIEQHKIKHIMGINKSKRRML